MKHYGLVGKSLAHSFSQNYFTQKFEKEGINAEYNNYELASIDLLLNLFNDDSQLVGLNITIPYKQTVIPYLDELDKAAQEVGAVNTIKKMLDGSLRGFNSDVIGFETELASFIKGTELSALVLGTGGASNAVQYVLSKLSIPFKLISRTPSKEQLAYEDLSELLVQEHLLIINCTPLGTWPNVNEKPPFPYHLLTPAHYLYDLVYNPAETAFLQEGKLSGASTLNGYGMLVAQAEASWAIWNS
jgi:shikimate dehydrogenase